MKKTLLAVAIVVLAVPASAVDKKEAAYMGGTLEELKDKIDGRVTTVGDSFVWQSKEEKRPKRIAIPYASITELEYGQKAGHRIKTAILLSPLALFKKSRKHYVTISYTDAESKPQAVLFEFGKQIIRTDLKMMSVKAEKPIKFTDEDSQKHFAK